MEINIKTKYNIDDNLYKINASGNIDIYSIRNIVSEFSTIHNRIKTIYYLLCNGDSIILNESELQKKGYYSSKKEIISNLMSQL